MSTGICRWLILVISLSTWTTTTNSKEMRVVCYYTNWSVYRPGTAKFSPQNINPYLCTHLIYAFGGFTKENTLKPFDKYQDIEKGGYAKFTGLKTYNKNLKTMLAIGGWNEGSSRFSPMVANPERRKELVKNAIKFLRQNHFDGLDLDWEYPSFRDGGKPRDKDNYALLVKELREEFDRESEKTGRPRLLLTMAVPAGIEYINKGYDIPKLTKYLDWMNILSYDYHSAFEPAVNHHAPLYSLEEESEYNYDTELNIDYTIKHYLKLGADPNKLVMGIPTYGRSYTLFNPDASEIGAPADGPGEMGEATRENGYLAYYEICDYVKSQDWEVVQPNPNALGPYAFKGNQWVGYDDENIARKKAEYVAENNLGGIMFWAIDNDDFRGNCHGRPYPLIESAKEALLSAYGITDDNLISPPAKTLKSRTKSRSRGSNKDDDKKENTEITQITSNNSRRRNRIKSKSKDREVTTERSKPRRKESRKTTETTSTYSSLKVITPSYTTPAPPSTPDQGGSFKCEDEGFFPHPKDCKKYYWCLSGAGDSGIIAHQFTCPAGLYFNKAADSCDYSQNVLCNKKLAKATTTTEGSDVKATTTTTQKPVSTSRVPPKITAATSKTTFKFTTTTPTPVEEEYDDEEYYDDEEDDKKDSEEDPRVIKELINLIRKAGGIEELEKQLSSSIGGSDKTTPSSLSKTLYERVLSKAGKSSSGLKATKTYLSLNRNSRGPQNDGLTSVTNSEDQKQKVDRGRPQYTSILRQRTSSEKTSDNENTEDDENNKNNDNLTRLFKKPSEPIYTNIRRPKIGSSTEEPSIANKFNRNKALGESSDEDEINVTIAPVSGSSPQYINIRRQRPSTTEASTSKYVELRRGSTTLTQNNVDEVTPRYKTLQRGTTTVVNEMSDEESTTKRTRGTTTIAITTGDEIKDNKSKYKIFSRGSTTAGSSTTESNESSSPRQTLRPIINLSSNTPRLPIEDEFSTPHSVITISPESVIINTHSNLLTTKLTSEEPTTTDSKLSIDDIITQISTDSTIDKKTPQLFEPRPFSINTRGTTSSIKPYTETSTQITKIGRQTTHLIRVGGRRKSPTSSSRTSKTTTAPSTVPRTTKTTRRKFLPQTSKALESQEITTPRSLSRFRFISRRPSTTPRSKTTTKLPEIKNSDQTIESSNQQSLEENANDGDTTELGDIAAALYDIQQAPIPKKTSAITYPFSSTTTRSPTKPPTRSRTRYSTTSTPLIFPTTTKIIIQRKKRPQAFDKINPSYPNTFVPIGVDYDYYDESNGSILSKIPEHSKVLLHSNGVIECLDQGNFPHPISCKKFISCAKMENGKVLGWEYTCPKNLSFDPIGGICNWSAGLGCNEK